MASQERQLPESVVLGSETRTSFRQRAAERANDRHADCLLAIALAVLLAQTIHLRCRFTGRVKVAYSLGCTVSGFLQLSQYLRGNSGRFARTPNE
jgi:hypothetical protein